MCAARVFQSINACRMLMLYTIYMLAHWLNIIAQRLCKSNGSETSANDLSTHMDQHQPQTRTQTLVNNACISVYATTTIYLYSQTHRVPAICIPFITFCEARAVPPTIHPQYTISIYACVLDLYRFAVYVRGLTRLVQGVYSHIFPESFGCRPHHRRGGGIGAVGYVVRVSHRIALRHSSRTHSARVYT